MHIHTTAELCSTFCSAASASLPFSIVSTFESARGGCCAISSWRTRAYIKEPPSTTAFENHHKVGFTYRSKGQLRSNTDADATSWNHWVASTVCAAALAVPEMLWVSGEVTLIWRPVTYPIANLNAKFN